jgi:putative ABC transport system permease protein
MGDRQFLISDFTRYIIGYRRRIIEIAHNLTTIVYRDTVSTINLEYGTCFRAAWTIIFIPSESELTLNQADTVARGLTTVLRSAEQILPTTRMDISPQESLIRYSQRKSALTTLLLIFSLPVLGLLFYFLFSLSAITAQFQLEETAILVSRGASRLHLLGLASLETLILAVIGTPLGLGIGYLLAKAIGATDTFLTFNPRLDFPATFREL